VLETDVPQIAGGEGGKKNKRETSGSERKRVDPRILYKKVPEGERGGREICYQTGWEERRPQTTFSSGGDLLLQRSRGESCQSSSQGGRLGDIRPTFLWGGEVGEGRGGARSRRKGRGPFYLKLVHLSEREESSRSPSCKPLCSGREVARTEKGTHKAASWLNYHLRT